MQEIRDKFFDYAGVVKARPKRVGCWRRRNGVGRLFLQRLRPAEFRQTRPANNRRLGLLPLAARPFRQHATNTNQRLLDYFTLHCSPQGGEGGNESQTTTPTARNRSTRQLWDTNYVDASWIGSQPTNTM